MRISAQKVAQFQFNFPSEGVVAGKAFPLTITALGSDGQVMTDFRQAAKLSGAWRAAPDPILSEISVDGESFEFTNPGDQDLDLSGWEVELLPRSTYDRAFRRELPPGFILGPRGVFTWSGGSSSNGAMSTLPGPASLRLFLADLNRVQLRDMSGVVREQVLFSDSSFGSSGLLWGGSPMVLFGPSGTSLSRLGNQNHFQAADWATGGSSMGQLNPGLVFPWRGVLKEFSVSPGEIHFTNGTWMGSITVTSPATTAMLVLDVASGARFKSPKVRVGSLPALQLSLVQGELVGRENQAGPMATLRLSLPATAETNVTVLLDSSTPAEIAAPGSVVVRSGSSFVDFVVTNYDDAIADGRALVTLTGSALEYQSASITLANDDDEAGELWIQIPLGATENSGFIQETGQVFLAQPAAHDVEVGLSTALPVQVPPTVLIRSGRRSAEFPIRVGDDDFVNSLDRSIEIRAQIPNWPAAVGKIRVADEEDRSASLELPKTVVEGIPTVGVLRMVVPRDYPGELRLIERFPTRLVFPRSVAVPAGASSVPFPISISDDTEFNGYGATEIFATLDGAAITGGLVFLADDEVSLKKLAIAAPQAAFTGDSFPVQASLLGPDDVPQRTNVSGIVSLSVSPPLASIESGFETVPFSNGVFSGPLKVAGTALVASVEISAAGLTNRSEPMDLYPGRTVAGPTLDLALIPGRDTLLVSFGRETNANGLLVELDPRTGQRLRELQLATPASRLAVAEDGSIAWLGGADGYLQRVDLIAWKVEREFPLGAATDKYRTLDLAVCRGTTNLVAALIRPVAPRYPPSEVVAYRDGRRLPKTLSVNAGDIGNLILPGRTPTEIFVQTFEQLLRVELDDSGVKVVKAASPGGGSNFRYNAVLSGDSIYLGSGDHYSADTLGVINQQPGSGLWVMPFPEKGLVAFVQERNRFQVYNSNEPTSLSDHKLPYRSPDLRLSRLVRWGSVGLAALHSDRNDFWLFESPLLTDETADLSVAVESPVETIPLPTGESLGQLVFVNWTFVVTNRGPGVAYAAQLNLEAGQHFDLGSLAPGGVAKVTVTRGRYDLGFVREHATVSSSIRDPLIGDNSVLAETAFARPPVAKARQLMLAATAMAAVPGGDRIYVSVDHTRENPDGGVFVIDPVQGIPERLLAVGPHPQALALAADNSGLVALLGTNQLVHWDFGAAGVDWSLTITNESVLDFASFPDGSGRMAVVTTRQLMLLSGDKIAASLVRPASERRHLVISAGMVWTAEPGELRGYLPIANGLSLRKTRSLNLATGNYRFSADERRLFFSGSIYDIQADQFQSGPNGDGFLPVPERGLLYGFFGDAYDLTTLSRVGGEFPALMIPIGPQILQLVAWGSSGLATRDWTGRILIYETSLLHGAAADLALTSQLTQPIRSEERFTWRMAVTNRGEIKAERVRLTVTAGPDVRDLKMAGADFFRVRDQFYFELSDLPGHGVFEFALSGWSFGGGLYLSALAQGSLDDPDPSNNSVNLQVGVDFPTSDLVIELQHTPASGELGHEFEATWSITNRGPDAIQSTTAFVRHRPGLDIVGTDRGGPLPDCCGDVQNLGNLGPLAAGAGQTFTVRFRANVPGLFEFNGVVLGSVVDPDRSNNPNAGVTYVEAPPESYTNTIQEFQLPAGNYAWCEKRQQLLATWGSDVGLLSPENFKPKVIWPLPGAAGAIAPTSDGEFAWVVLDRNRLTRVRLADGSTDLTLRTRSDLIAPYAAFLPIPTSNEDVLLVSVGDSGKGEITLFKGGIPRPLGAGPFAWDGGFYLSGSPEGRMFFSSGSELMEISIKPDGTGTVRSFGFATGLRGGPYSFARGLIYDRAGAALDLATLSGVIAAFPDRTVVADPSSGWVYSASPGRVPLGGMPMTIQRSLGGDPALEWRLEAAIPVSEIRDIVPLGSHGVLLLGDKARLISTENLPPRLAQAAITVAPTVPVLGTNQTVTVKVAVTNASFWAARDLRLHLEFSAGLRSLGALSGGSNTLDLPLGTVITNANVSVDFLTLSSGPQFVRASLIGTMAGDDPSDDASTITFNTPPPPRFLLGDLRRPERDLGQITATLSIPAPTTLEVVYRVELITAQPQDVYSDRITFRFERGTQTATASLVRDDAEVELEERLRLVFESGNVQPMQPSSEVTIIDDDLPSLTVNSVVLKEGNRGTSLAQVPVRLLSDTAIPVLVSYEVAGGTARPGSDFIPSTGSLWFGPGHLTNFIEIPIVGDLEFEPSESIIVSLTDLVRVRSGVVQSTLTILNDDPAPMPLSRWKFGATNQPVLSFDSVPGVKYQLQSRTNLITGKWANFGTAVLGTGNPMTLETPAKLEPARFFRVTAE